jgi:hypothetical protein
MKEMYLEGYYKWNEREEMKAEEKMKRRRSMSMKIRERRNEMISWNENVNEMNNERKIMWMSMDES